MGGRKPLCFYGGAFPHERHPSTHPPKEVCKDASLLCPGTFSQS